MPTTNIRTVKPAGGGNFTSLANWEAATMGDLVALDTIEIAECYAGSDITATNIDGWTTGPNNYIEIRSAVVDRHAGKWDLAKQVLGPPAAGIMLTVTEDYVRLRSLQVLGVAAVTVVTVGAGTAGNNSIVVDSCIFSTPQLGANSSFLLHTLGRIGVVSNCVGFSTGTVQGRGFGGNVTSTGYNCVSDGSTSGFRLGNWVNCVSINCIVAMATVASATNCIGDTADILTAPGSGNKQGTPAFVSAATGDFHLQAGDTVATNFGLNETGIFTNDIDGQTRPATGPWDAGVDQISAGSGGGTGVVNDPQALMNASACYGCLSPVQNAVNTYLLATWANLP